MATKSETFFGGKGANQAVGTARLGANTLFIGCVGMDPYGQQILRNLVDQNVNVGFVHEDIDVATGTLMLPLLVEKRHSGSSFCQLFFKTRAS
jgi:ribokinase